MDKLLGRFGKAKEHERSSTTLDHYTVHAVKKGALSQLVSRAAQIPEFPIWLIPLLAKHKSPQEQIPQVTVGYLNHPNVRVDTARLLRTQEATQLLDPS